MENWQFIHSSLDYTHAQTVSQNYQKIANQKSQWMQRPAIQFTTSFFQKKKRKKEQFGQQNSARHRKCWLLSCWQHNAATRNKVLNALIFQKPIVLIKESRNVAAPIDKRQHNSGPRIGLGTYVNCMQSKTSFLQHVVLEYQLVLQSTTALLSLYINQGSNG